MTAAEQADLHILLLQFLRAKKDIGRIDSALLNDVRLAGGFDQVTLVQLNVELAILAEKMWIAPMDFDLGPRRWVLTTRGETKLTAAGL